MTEMKMESRQSTFEPIRVTLTKDQITALVADEVMDATPLTIDEEEGRALIARAVEALDRLGLIVREAE
jgi:hypothetical protein